MKRYEDKKLQEAYENGWLDAHKHQIKKCQGVLDTADYYKSMQKNGDVYWHWLPEE